VGVTCRGRAISFLSASSRHSSPVPPLPSFVFTLAATGTTLSISMFSSAEYSVWRTVWNSLVGLKTAFALRAAPALWRANRAWSSPMISSAAASGMRSPLILSSKLCLKNEAPFSPVTRRMAASSLVPR